MHLREILLLLVYKQTNEKPYIKQLSSNILFSMKKTIMLGEKSEKLLRITGYPNNNG